MEGTENLDKIKGQLLKHPDAASIGELDIKAAFSNFKLKFDENV